MKTFFLVAGALLLAGCHVNVDEPTVKATQPGTTAGSSGATAGNTSEKAAVAQEQTKPTPAEGQIPNVQDDTKKPGFNEHRLHQLYDLKTAELSINGHKLKTWIMDNDSLREEGMMFLKDEDVKPDETMLFVFPDSTERGFWMHNTLIPLDIAYIAPDKTVVRATSMKALDESNVPSNGKAMYALEMKKGTIERLGIKKGTKVDIPADIKATQ